MLILSAEEIRKVESDAVLSGLSYKEMMENAGRGCADFIISRYHKDNSVVVLCGKGKNGGDGFVIARRLYNAGFPVHVISMFDSESDALSEEMRRLLPAGVTQSVFSDESEEYISRCDIIADAVFCIGFKGALPENIRTLFNKFRDFRAVKIAVDMPSGLSRRAEALPYRADFTLSMLCFKPEHIYKPWKDCCGETHIIPIGFSVNAAPGVFSLRSDEIKQLLPQRAYDSHKGAFGRTLIIAGSRNMPGAAVMAASGAVNTGAGIVSLAFPDCCYEAIAPQLRECLLMPQKSAADGGFSKSAAIHIADICDNYTSVAIGCGLGVSDGAAELVFSLIKNYTGKLIIDADGINIISRNINILKEAAGDIALTPHPGEMSRLTRLSINEINSKREQTAESFAGQYGVCLLLKGANTVIADKNGRLFINPTGSPALSRGGSGDLLTGIAASFAAQGMPLCEALSAAAFVHGAAGESAGAKFTEYAATIERVTAQLPGVLSHILRGM